MLIVVAMLLVFIYRMTVLNPGSMGTIFIIIPGLVALIFLFYNPKVCIVLLTLWIPFRNLLVGGVGKRFEGYDAFAILPEPVKYLDTYLLGILTIIWISRNFFYREPYIKTPMDLPILIFISLASVSAIGNLVNPIVAITGVRTFLQFALFYYAVVQLKLEEGFLKKIVILYIGLAMIQTPVSVYNYLSVSSQTESMELLGDSTIGTFKGGTNLLAHYQGMMMIIVLGLIKFNPKKMFIYILIFISFMISFFTASGRGAIYLFPLAAIFVLNLELKKIGDFVRSNFQLFFIFTCIISFLTISGIMYKYYGENLEKLSPSLLYENFMLEDEMYNGMYSGRNTSYRFAWNDLMKESFSPFLGVGSGMWLSNTGKFFEVPLYLKYNLSGSDADYYYGLESALATDLPVLLTEFGFLGVIAFGFIFFKIFKNFKEGVSLFDDPFWKGISAGSVGVLIMITLASIAERTLESIFIQYLLWFFTGVIYQMRLIKEEVTKVGK